MAHRMRHEPLQGFSRSQHHGGPDQEQPAYQPGRGRPGPAQPSMPSVQLFQDAHTSFALAFPWSPRKEAVRPAPQWASSWQSDYRGVTPSAPVESWTFCRDSLGLWTLHRALGCSVGSIEVMGAPRDSMDPSWNSMDASWNPESGEACRLSPHTLPSLLPGSHWQVWATDAPGPTVPRPW